MTVPLTSQKNIADNAPRVRDQLGLPALFDAKLDSTPAAFQTLLSGWIDTLDPAPPAAGATRQFWNNGGTLAWVDPV